jgi:hypothetical protein
MAAEITATQATRSEIVALATHNGMEMAIARRTSLLT